MPTVQQPRASSGVEARALPDVTGVAPEDLPGAFGDFDGPTVLRGLAAGWPAVRAARRSAGDVARHLRGFDAGAPVAAYALPAAERGRVFYGDGLEGFNFQPVRLPLGELLDRLLEADGQADAPTLYLGSTDVDRCLPGFRADNDLPLETLDPLVSIWIGNRARIAAHYDMPDNLACVVAGRRRFTLFPPEQRGNLYVGPIDHTPSGQEISLVDFAAPDFDAHPRFREALRHARVADLAPGDAIYIPGMWWHHVESGAALNVLVNWWWRTVPAWMGAPVDALKLALLNLRGLPPAQRRAWRDIFDRYVFADDDEAVAHIPEARRGILGPLDETAARRLRAELLNRLKR